MESCQLAHPEPKHKGYTGTTRKLMDSLVIYRTELGETGRQVEILLRMYGIKATMDQPVSKRVH